MGYWSLSTTSWAQTSSPTAEEIAKTYGLESFSQIETIRYTFNAVGAINLSRTWVWEPKSGQVSYDGKDKSGKPVKVTYQRSQVSSQAAVVKGEITPAFINDQYNLLFPLHLSWDTSAKVEDTGMQKLPHGKGSAKKIVVTYPSAGGYTPGDVWFRSMEVNVVEFLTREAAADCNEPRMVHPRRDNHQSTDKA